MTEDALRVSHEIADRIGMSFDPIQTKELAEKLYEEYFAAITRVIGISGPTFQSSALRKVNAFAHFTGDRDEIFFDEQLDFWLLNCCHLTLVAACEQLDSDQYTELIRLLVKTKVPASDKILLSDVIPS